MWLSLFHWRWTEAIKKVDGWTQTESHMGHTAGHAIWCAENKLFLIKNSEGGQKDEVSESAVVYKNNLIYVIILPTWWAFSWIPPHVSANIIYNRSGNLKDCFRRNWHIVWALIIIHTVEPPSLLRPPWHWAKVTWIATGDYSNNTTNNTNLIYTLKSKVDLCSEVSTVQYSIKYKTYLRYKN